LRVGVEGKEVGVAVANVMVRGVEEGVAAGAAVGVAPLAGRSCSPLPTDGRKTELSPFVGVGEAADNGEVATLGEALGARESTAVGDTVGAGPERQAAALINKTNKSRPGRPAHHLRQRAA
jgi:hypothetical protein